eukprot:TRINITY_DN986_c0_g1_i5.p1 TRINITY_DN986_c0_g1~~TRINITY_DN986_c0_g1_i5.p1  ORF type:complete len:354 (-),score=8.29 TRINITY_DN986_c0_g1_i5:39-1100(-)
MFPGWRRGPAVEADADYVFYCWLADAFCNKPRYHDRFLPLAADLIVDGLRTPNANFKSATAFVKDVMTRCFVKLSDNGYQRQFVTFSCALVANGAYDTLLQMLNMGANSEVVSMLLCLQNGVTFARQKYDISPVPNTDVAAFLRLVAAYIEQKKLAVCSLMFISGLAIFADALAVLRANIKVFICCLLSEFESATCETTIGRCPTALLNLMLLSPDPTSFAESIEQRLAFQSADNTPAFRHLLSMVKRVAKKMPAIQGKMMLFVNTCRAAIDADDVHPTIRLFVNDPVCKRFVCALPSCRTHVCFDPHQLGTLSLKACAQCRAAYYCDRECQTAHWNKHKKRCKSTLDFLGVP